MDTQDELDRLRTEAVNLRRDMRRTEREIKRAVHFISIGRNAARAIEFLQDRLERQLGHMYDLGKLDLRIERLQELSPSRDERHEPDYADADGENYLDWLEPVLHGSNLDVNSPDERRSQRAEQDGNRHGRDADDHRDWLR